MTAIGSSDPCIQLSRPWTLGYGWRDVAAPPCCFSIIGTCQESVNVYHLRKSPAIPFTCGISTCRQFGWISEGHQQASKVADTDPWYDPAFPCRIDRGGRSPFLRYNSAWRRRMPHPDDYMQRLFRWASAQSQWFPRATRKYMQRWASDALR